jgi:YD repeat-containing protein
MSLQTRLSDIAWPVKRLLPLDTYTWNARNQLTKVSQNGNAQLSYSYDALGRRISKATSGGTPMQYLYDADNIVQETQGGNINAILTRLSIDERFARTDVTGRTYFLTDQLNSPIALTDPTGAIQQQYSCDSYGNVTQSNMTTGFTNPYQYTGRRDRGQSPFASFAVSNLAMADPAIVSITIPNSVINDLTGDGSLSVNGSIYTFEPGAINTLDQNANFQMVPYK